MHVFYTIFSEGMLDIHAIFQQHDQWGRWNIGQRMEGLWEGKINPLISPSVYFKLQTCMNGSVICLCCHALLKLFCPQIFNMIYLNTSH